MKLAKTSKFGEGWMVQQTTAEGGWGANDSTEDEPGLGRGAAQRSKRSPAAKCELGPTGCVSLAGRERLISFMLIHLLKKKKVG